MEKSNRTQKAETRKASRTVLAGSARATAKPVTEKGKVSRKKAHPAGASLILNASPLLGNRIEKGSTQGRAEVYEQLRLGMLLSEKCELGEARKAFERALDAARSISDMRLAMEAISGLLRLAGEALDMDRIERLEQELDEWMRRHPDSIPSMAWHCKGAVARHQERTSTAQHCFLMALRAIREESEGLPGIEPGDRLWVSREEKLARAYLPLAAVQNRRGNVERARRMAGALLRRYGSREFRSIPGVLFLLMGRMDESAQRLESAMGWYRKAHAAFLAEHNWYFSLSVLFAYARIARLQRNYSQALWHLELVENACRGPEFGMLRREISLERKRLEGDQVDLLIDSRKGLIKTRETGEPISLKKQYVLLHILEALADAHARPGDDAGRGLSKSELIEKVWGETYRPQAHDNKLYYNINRLRKLIEQDMREPVYVQNWREGYRLGPELRVRWVREESENWGKSS